VISQCFFVELTSLPSSNWRFCPRCSGIIASITLALLPVFCWCLRRCFAGIVAVVALVSLPSLHCCHHCAGIVVLIAMVLTPTGVFAGIPLASTPLLRWGFHWRHCWHHVFAVVALALLPCIMLASSPVFRWHHHPRHAGANAIILLAPLLSSPLLRLGW